MAPHANGNNYHATANGHSLNGFLASDTAGKVIKCKAAVLYTPGEPFVIEEIEVEPPKEMEVRVKILFTTICHTDLSCWAAKNDERQQVYPRILGHEASGIVESVGKGVEDLKPGDHVVPIFQGECSSCRYCLSSKTNLCATHRVNPFRSVMIGDGKTRFFVTGADGERKPVYHFMNTSTFSEYSVMDSACVVRINPEAPLEKMCLLSCCVSTGLGAAWNTADVHEGSTVAVFGLGAVGLAAAEGARLRGASRIIGVDINPEKWEKGQEMGVTDFINPLDYTRPVSDVIRGVVKGGVDHSFECSGNLNVLREAFLSTHDGWGTTTILGIHASPKTLPLHPMELFDGRKIIGSNFGDFKGKSQLPDLVDKCISGDVKINFDGFITHELPFAEINKAVKLLHEGKSLRCLIRL